jgi:hypothetical protein
VPVARCSKVEGMPALLQRRQTRAVRNIEIPERDAHSRSKEGASCRTTTRCRAVREKVVYSSYPLA